MQSDTNSNTTLYNTTSQFNNSDIETPDEFANSEPSTSTFFRPPFQPIHSQFKIEPPSPPSPISNVTSIYSILTSEPSDNNDSDNTQISHELDNFIKLQQQLQRPQTLTIHQLSRSITSSNPSTPTPSSNYTPSQNPTSSSTASSSTTRAYRTFRRKFSNTPFPSNPGTSTSFVNHPLHTNTKPFCKICLPFFPQYTYFHSDPNDEKPNYVNELVLYPTLSWTSNYHFTKPLSLPLYNNPHDNEVCSTQLYLLTTALTPKQFTQIGYRQALTKFTAPMANDYSIDYYDHNIIRPNEDIFLNNDPFANPQLRENFFIKTPYTFTLNILNKKHENVISAAHVRDIHAYDSYFNKFNHFSLTFHFLRPKERDLHCSHEVMLRTKQTHTYAYYKFMQHHYTLNTPARHFRHRYQYINSKVIP